LIARRHAEIEATPGGFVLRDFAEPGRTRVNGVAVSGPTPLRDGDRVEVGRTQLLFRQR
jgi:pSer/pThr/pTyr-binding forkhead associated (FHA) protein